MKKGKGAASAAAPAGKARIITIDFTGVESGGGMTHIPEGDYCGRVTKVQHKNSESSNKPALFLMVKVTRGNKRGIGKQLRHTCSLQKQALFNLRNLLEAMGKTVPSKAVKLDINKLIGPEFAFTVADDEYEGRTKSVISAFFPVSDFGKTSETGDELEEGTEETEETEKTEEAEGEETEETEETEEAGEEEELFS